MREAGGIYDLQKELTKLVPGVVPAGLIGGRLGNKGGVGISVNIQGTTLLFINAHLAGRFYTSPEQGRVLHFMLSSRRKGPITCG